jgi:hypothetical protein
MSLSKRGMIKLLTVHLHSCVGAFVRGSQGQATLDDGVNTMPDMLGRVLTGMGRLERSDWVPTLPGVHD